MNYVGGTRLRYSSADDLLKQKQIGEGGYHSNALWFLCGERLMQFFLFCFFFSDISLSVCVCVCARALKNQSRLSTVCLLLYIFFYPNILSSSADNQRTFFSMPFFINYDHIFYLKWALASNWAWYASGLIKKKNHVTASDFSCRRPMAAQQQEHAVRYITWARPLPPFCLG